MRRFWHCFKTSLSRYHGLAFAAGLLAALGQAPLGFSYLALFAFAVGLGQFKQATSAKSAALMGWLFGFGMFLFALSWMVNPFLVEPLRHAWMIPFALFFMCGGLALLWALAFGIAYRLSFGLIGLVALLGLVEFARGWIFTGFPWALPAYIWLDQPLAHLAAVIGPYGLTTLTFAMAASLVWAYRIPGPWAKSITAVGLVALFGAGSVIKSTPLAPDTDYKLRIVQPNAAQHLKWHPDHIETFFARALALSSSPDEVDLVIWPETSVPAPLYAASSYFNQIGFATGTAQTIVGLNAVDGMRGYNSAVLLDATGTQIARYDKRHLVPFGEYIPLPALLERLGMRGFAAKNGYGFSAGHSSDLFETAAGKAMIAICYEAIFPRDMRSENRPDYLLQMTNDAWFGNFSGPQQALAQARFRAIELGLPMLRAANTGISGVIDPHGDLRASIPLGQAGVTDALLPSAAPETFYAQYKEWSGFILLTLLMILQIVVTMLRRRKTI